MKPKPLSSLTHFTVPVGMWELLHGMCVLLRGGCCLELRPASACTTFAGLLCRPDLTTVAGPRVRVLSGCCSANDLAFACLRRKTRLGWANGRRSREESHAREGGARAQKP